MAELNSPVIFETIIHLGCSGYTDAAKIVSKKTGKADEP